MFKKILIANRGEIACRIIKTAKKMGIKTVAVFSDADQNSLHVKMADERYYIGESPASKSYLIGERIIEACIKTGAEAVHPGYGFLSENANFCEQLTKAGITFIGPETKAIQSMGDKIVSKKIAAEAGVSTVPGHMGLIEDVAEAVKISNIVGYPVMIKASAGGGGKGMRIAWNDEEAKEGFERSKSEALASFGDDRIFIEKFITNPRHIEIQILADSHGNCIYLGERECSIQRRNQKVIEEAPSPFLDEKTRKAMGEQSVLLAMAVDYQSVGTVEFIVDDQHNFFFLEMNTRLQVEHPVTELITGLDLVEQMILVASGEKLTVQQSDVKLNGWAIESRLYAEDPYRNFLPSVGRLNRYRPPKEITESSLIVRNDTGVYEGGEISTFYDPMIAKLCTWAPTRIEAINAMSNALDAFEIEGVGHNIPFLSAVMSQNRFRDGRLTTNYIAEEFPDGFNGVELTTNMLKNLAIIAAAALYRYEKLKYFSASEKIIERTITIIIGEHRWDFSLSTSAEELLIVDKAGDEFNVKDNWNVGDHIAETWINGKRFCVKIDKLTNGFRMRYRGADVIVKVLETHVADLMPLMPIKIPKDMSKYLLCPMPGLIVQLNVEVGQIVEDNQTLAIIEAMKMENVLKAEKRCKIAKINVDVGDSLAVDEIIMEFEDI